jgi:hypothetical protein
MIIDVLLVIFGVCLALIVMATLVSAPYDNDDNDDQIL